MSPAKLVLFASAVLLPAACGAPHPQARRPRFLPPAEFVELESIEAVPAMGGVGAHLFRRVALLYPTGDGFSADLQRPYVGWIPAIPLWLLTLEGPGARMVFMDDGAVPSGSLRIDGHYFEGPFLIVDRDWRIHRIRPGKDPGLDTWFMAQFLRGTDPKRRHNARRDLLKL